MKHLDSLIDHGPFVANLARQLVLDENEVEDVVQDTWLVALERPPLHAANPRGWLRRVVRSQALNRMRSQRRRTAHEASAEVGCVPAPPEVLAERRIRACLDAALTALAPRYREVIVLRYLEGVPPREIARRAGLPVETVRTRVKRGLATLRGRLDREYGKQRAAWVGPLLHWAERCSSSSAQVGMSATAFGGAVVLLLLGAPLVALAARAESGTAPTAADTRQTAASTLSDRQQGLQPPRPSTRTSQIVPPGSPGALRVTLRWRDSLEPLPGVGLRLRERDEPIGSASRAQADAAGVAFLEDLAPGPWTILPELGEQRTALVRPGETTDVVFDVDRQATFRGLVRFVTGRPCAGATILASVPGEPELLREVASSDVRGRFETPPLAADSWIGARFENLQSHLLHLRGTPLLAEEGLELLLPDVVGTSLALTVLDSSGDPIDGAEVALLYKPSGIPVLRLDGLLSLTPPALGYRTGRDGSLRLENLQQAQFGLVVRAPGRAPLWHPTPPGRPSHRQVTLRMQPGAVIEGTVVDRHGAPASGASVRVQGPEPLPPVHVRSDEAGRFRVCEAPLGPVRLEAWADSGFATAGHVTAELTLAAGEVVRPKLALTDSLVSGRIVLPDGTPAVGWRVALGKGVGQEPSAESLIEPASAVRWRHSDELGRFLFAVDDDSYVLQAWAPESPPRAPDAWLAAVRPGAARVTIRPQAATGSIEGRLVNAAGDPVAEADVLLSSDLLFRPRRVPVDPGTGRFRTGPLPAGTWWLSVWPWDAAPIFGLAQVDLDDVGPVALGDLSIPEPGSLHVHLSLPDGHPVQRANVRLKAGGFVATSRPLPSRDGFTLASDGSLELPVLRAGRYDLAVHTMGYPSLRERVEVLPGRRSEYWFSLSEPQTAVRFAVALPSAGRAKQRLEIRVLDGSGSEVRALTLAVPRNQPTAPFAVEELDRGSHTLSVSLHVPGRGAFEGSVPFEVPAAAGGLPIAVELQRVD